MLGLLAVWRALGLDAILRECWEAGVVLAGLSAGAMCWFEWGVTTSLGAPAPAPGLGFLPGSLSVHADGEPARLPVYRRRRAPPARSRPATRPTTASRCCSAATELAEVVSSRPHRRALRIAPDARGAVSRRAG